jgi:hypothetical protein
MSLSLESVLRREQPNFMTSLGLPAASLEGGVGQRVAGDASNAMMRPVAVSLFTLFLLIPAAASAITVQDVVSMSRAGVSDEVIIALIEQDPTVFSVKPAQVIELKRDGVSERVVLALLRSGRQPDSPPPSPTAPASSDGTPSPPTEPSLLVVGHGPDRPNTYHSFDEGAGFPPVVYTVPYAPYVPGNLAPRCMSNGQRARTTKTSGLHQAAASFVNSTLLPMLNESEPAVADCAPPPPRSPGGQSNQRRR